MTDDGRQPQLDYALPLRWRRRKATRRWLVLGLVGACAIVWGPGLWNRLQVLWWQRQCLAYVALANQVVYDDGPAVSQLLSAGGMISSQNPASTRQPAAARTVKCWDRLRQFVPGTGQSHAVLYLHRSRDDSGAERLIVVELSYRQHYQLGFDCWDLLTATPVRTMGLEANSYTFPMPFDAADKPLRLYAGQPDPNDPAGFTIPYDLDGQPGTIEGWVNENGGVSLAAKDGPAKEPLLPSGLKRRPK